MVDGKADETCRPLPLKPLSHTQFCAPISQNKSTHAEFRALNDTPRANQPGTYSCWVPIPLGKPSPFFPRILLSRKPPESQVKRLRFLKRRIAFLGSLSFSLLTSVTAKRSRNFRSWCIASPLLTVWLLRRQGEKFIGTSCN